MYLVAIIDWYSGDGLSWRVSNTMGSDFCLEALEESLALYDSPEIFNSDQGAQLTSKAFTERLVQAGVTISMYCRGRLRDNIIVERPWHSVKHECLYLTEPVTGNDLKKMRFSKVFL
ncbi:MAG: DDE-type integrase/transposase/recombinase [Desulfovibrio sp.]|nr:DDE-type integrase/transposase/recombinase [Desulfovibrio sp.]